MTHDGRKHQKDVSYLVDPCCDAQWLIGGVDKMDKIPANFDPFGAKQDETGDARWQVHNSTHTAHYRRWTKNQILAFGSSAFKRTYKIVKDGHCLSSTVVTWDTAKIIEGASCRKLANLALALQLDNMDVENHLVVDERSLPKGHDYLITSGSVKGFERFVHLL